MSSAQSSPVLAASRTCRVSPASGPLPLLLSDASVIVCVLSHSVVSGLCKNLWTVAYHAPLFTGFSQQEYWVGWPFPPAGDLPHSRIKPSSPVAPALAGRLFRTEPLEKPPVTVHQFKKLLSPYGQADNRIMVPFDIQEAFYSL